MKTNCLALDQELDIPVGAVLRLKPMVDDDGQMFGYWVIDDATGEPLDLVSAECVLRTLPPPTFAGPWFLFGARPATVPTVDHFVGRSIRPSVTD
jgi:hypothetical protein